MAKKIDVDKLISTELENFENKLKEFQDYLLINSIIYPKSNSVRIDELNMTEEDQEKLHKEISIQIKMQDAVLTWLPLLDKLRETKAEKTMDVRSNEEMAGLFKNRMNG